MDKNEARTGQNKTNDREAASEDQREPLAGSSKSHQRNGGKCDCKDPAGELKLCVKGRIGMVRESSQPPGHQDCKTPHRDRRPQSWGPPQEIPFRANPVDAGSLAPPSTCAELSAKHSL